MDYGKLIELLNEYVEEKDFGDDLNEYNEADIIDEETLEVNGKYHDIEYLYTKKFGFIKWLVENDKIDFNKVSKKEIESGLSIVMRGVLFIETNWVLMLLAIQDSAIEFLISILK